VTRTLFTEDSYLQECAATVVAAADGAVILDQTVFYAAGGGQPGDTGGLYLADGRVLPVTDTRKSENGILHLVGAEVELPAPGTVLTARIDWDRRHRLMRMHTCLHLLSAVLPFPVTGGQVSDGKGRLDFDMPDGSPDRDQVNEAVNRLITANLPVAIDQITDAELAAKPDLVKTMMVKPPSGAGQVRLIRIDGADLQPCGGTHVARTGEIGPVVITKIEKKGRLNRRVALEFLA